MSSQSYNLGDFAESGQLSLTAARHAPKKDYPHAVGGYKRKRTGVGAAVAWSDGSETVEILAVRTPHGIDYEAIATQGGRTSTIAIEDTEQEAVAAAVEHMRGQ